MERNHATPADRDEARTFITSSRPYIAAAAIVATAATAGSLYFSYGMGLYPCDLCWFQRVCMYPLVAVLGVGAYERRDVSTTALCLAVPGLLLSSYHSYLQMGGASECSIGAGCGTIQYQIFGLSIPNLAWIAFLAIAVLALGSRARR